MWDALVCPICDEGLVRMPTSARCRNGHSFDIARQGYLNLSTGRAAPRSADTAAMVQARAAFLATGHFRPLAHALAERAASLYEGGSVIDAGAGTGYHLAAVLDEDEHLEGLRGYAEDSGEGRWTVEAAVEHAVPLPAITASLFARFSSRQEDSPQMKMIAALRNQFGGHAVEKRK